MGKKIAVLAFLLVFFSGGQALAQDKAAPPSADAEMAENMPADADIPAKTSSGLPIPRFVSLSSEKVFVRTGPALRYPIKWVYQRVNLPVEVIQEFDTWRKIRDVDGDAGWVHQSLLSGDRTAVVKGEANLALRSEADSSAPVQAYLEPGVVAFTESCKGGWCAVASQGYKGWAERKFLWGIYDSEDFD